MQSHGIRLGEILEKNKMVFLNSQKDLLSNGLVDYVDSTKHYTKNDLKRAAKKR